MHGENFKRKKKKFPNEKRKAKSFLRAVGDGLYIFFNEGGSESKTFM